MRQEYERIALEGAEVIAICPEGPRTVRAYWESERLPFVGIPDPDHKIADAYGQRSSLLKLGRLPALVVIERGGIVRLAHYGDSMADIPSTGTLLGWIPQPGSSDAKAE